jgi:hypothetical protein
VSIQCTYTGTQSTPTMHSVGPRSRDTMRSTDRHGTQGAGACQITSTSPPICAYYAALHCSGLHGRMSCHSFALPSEATNEPACLDGLLNNCLVACASKRFVLPVREWLDKLLARQGEGKQRHARMLARTPAERQPAGPGQRGGHHHFDLPSYPLPVRSIHPSIWHCTICYGTVVPHMHGADCRTTHVAEFYINNIKLIARYDDTQSYLMYRQLNFT